MQANVQTFPHPFPMPEDAVLNDWQRLIKAEIAWMNANRLPYDWGEHYGSIESYTHKGPQDNTARKILGASPGSYCCGATGELFLRCWKRFMAGYEGDDISSGQMFELVLRYFFRRIDIDPKYLKGAAIGLKELADQSEWLDVGYTENPNDAPFGAFLQMDFTGGKGKRGHSAVIVGHGMINARPVLYVWSSNKNYSPDSPYTRNQPDGHGFDWYYKDAKDREFYCGWIVP